MEGTLSDEAKSEVLLFLEQHPDIAEEFDGLSETVLPKEELSCDIKSQLKHVELDTPKLITEANYESYFVRSVDGDLDVSEKREMLLFLQAYPQYSLAFELFQKTRLKPDLSIQFTDKNVLKDVSICAVDGIDKDNFEEYFVAFHEGDLNETSMELVNRFIAENPHTKHAFDLLAQTFVNADPSIVFEDKDSLKQSIAIAPKRRIVYFQRVAVAATLVFAFMFSWNYYKDASQTIEQMGIAQRKQYNHKLPQFASITPEESENTVSKVAQIYTRIEPIKSDLPVVETPSNTIDEYAVEPLESRSVTALASVETKPNLTQRYFAPKGDQLEGSPTLWGYATAFIKSHSPFLKDIEDQAKDTFDPNSVEYRGIDLWDVAQVGVRSFNQLTENDVQLAKNKRLDAQP
jgi:hypothetical protein